MKHSNSQRNWTKSNKTKNKPEKYHCKRKPAKKKDNKKPKRLVWPLFVCRIVNPDCPVTDKSTLIVWVFEIISNCIFFFGLELIFDSFKNISLYLILKLVRKTTIFHSAFCINSKYHCKNQKTRKLEKICLNFFQFQVEHKWQITNHNEESNHENIWEAKLWSWYFFIGVWKCKKNYKFIGIFSFI